MKKLHLQSRGRALHTQLAEAALSGLVHLQRWFVKTLSF